MQGWSMMSGATVADDSSNPITMDAVADPLDNSSGPSTGTAEKVRSTVGQAAPNVMRAMSRATYTSAYVLAYGVVYASVFVAKSVPQDNAFMHGLLDGSFAARDAVNDGTSAARDDLNQVT